MHEVGCLHSIEDMHEGEPEMNEEWFMDDISGQVLDPAGVKEARREELEVVKEMDLYWRMSVAQAKGMGAKSFIDTRWVDTNKGTSEDPNFRSRLVAKEINRKAREDLYAPTPSLEAFKTLLAMLCCRGKGGPSNWRLMVVDVKRAFFYAPAERPIWIKLPPEDQCGDITVARLLKAMYGTRDAPMLWQKHVSKTLETLGFRPGKANPCVYYHGGGS